MNQLRPRSLTPWILGGALVAVAIVLWVWPECLPSECGNPKFWISSLLTLGIGIPGFSLALRIWQNRRVVSSVAESAAKATAAPKQQTEVNLNVSGSNGATSSEKQQYDLVDPEELYRFACQQTFEAILFEMVGELAERAKGLAGQLTSESDAKHYRQKHLKSIENLSRELSNFEQLRWFAIAAEHHGTPIALKKQLIGHVISILGVHQKRYLDLNKTTKANKESTCNDDYKDLLRTIADELLDFHRKVLALNQKCHSLGQSPTQQVDIPERNVVRSKLK